MRDKASHRYAVVVAGGSGTRLWPLSRRDLPKQMQKFVSDRTLIDETIDRLGSVVPLDNIYISTSQNYAPQIAKLLPQIPTENIITEPIARGTTAAFALFTQIIYNRDSKAIIFSMASDHAVADKAEFQSTVNDSFDYIGGHKKQILTIGIKPTKPDPSLGYIKTDQPVQKAPRIYSVEKFIEKPSVGVAKTYLDSGGYYWNAAYYCFAASTLMKAYEDADEAIMRWTRRFIKSRRASDFKKVPQKAHEIELINPNKFALRLLPADFRWSDIGTWQALHSLLSKSSGSDVVQKGGQHVDIDSQDCLVYAADQRLVATIGLKNIAIISTDDVLMVIDKGRDQDVKKLLETIKAKGLDKYL